MIKGLRPRLVLPVLLAVGLWAALPLAPDIAGTFLVHGASQASKRNPQSEGPPVSAGTPLAWTNPDFTAPELLGRPTNGSVAISVIPAVEMEIFYDYGVAPGTYEGRTAISTAKSGIPLVTTIGGLQPDTRYFYRLRYRKKGGGTFLALGEHAFHTGRPPGASFVFAVQADPHRDENSDLDLYCLTLQNILREQPDFLIDLGDTFMTEKFARNEPEVVARYLEERRYFGLIAHSIPLYLVNGNHEGENGWQLNGTSDNLAVWATRARKLYYLNPVPGAFYGGNAKEEPFVGRRDSYYAWEWGGLLFVVLDPFWYTAKKSGQNGDNWDWTLGRDQYLWLRQTLGASRAKFKFVFLHNLPGGLDKNARGGSEAAMLYEWGGRNADGTPGFAGKRPGWEKPIHQLLVEDGVQAVFHGHDHFFARQELDGVVYQLVPQPSHAGAGTKTQAAEYGYRDGVFLTSSGYLRLTVAPNQVKVDYIRTRLPREESGERRNGQVEYSYVIQ